MFENKIILIVGGTGSFGKALTTKVLEKNYKIKEIRIFSRDEKKQEDMRKNFNNFKLTFYLGDVRDKESLNYAMKNVDYVFHAAALKQVPSCEFYPMEAVKTNISGTNNVLDSAIENKVKKIICLSTDKAVYPINAMGISKALMEKLAISKTLNKDHKTVICITRYGNVLGSRNSIIPVLLDRIGKNLPILLTSEHMTRFLMTMEDAIDLVMYAFINGKNGEIYIKKCPSAKITELINSVLSLKQIKKYKIKKIGVRPGEKIDETLITVEELSRTIDKKFFFIIKPDIKDLNYKHYYVTGNIDVEKINDYSSNSVEIIKGLKLEKKLIKSKALS
jgi:UDP-N-acetylglucosamine 4,6-dehydratase/5-epimerase|tara:strand:- start:18578 stop:19579 length:1002 start_codon:yes stop_codon:yes gene_type:complete